MRAATFLALADKLPLQTLSDLVGDRGLVVVAPHPDDESLGCGGLIAEACRTNVPVRLVVVSDGTGSHAGSRRWPPAALRDLREHETIEAVSALGLSSEAVHFLRLADRFVPSEGEDAVAAAMTIASAARDVDAGAICVTWRHDPHCDHRAAAAIVDLAHAHFPAARVFAYPIWGWTLPDDYEVDGPPRGARIDVARHRAARRCAVAAHRSQITDLIDDCPDGFRLTSAMIDRFDRPYEILLEEA